jgi:hypothetical protein
MGVVAIYLLEGGAILYLQTIRDGDHDGFLPLLASLP